MFEKTDTELLRICTAGSVDDGKSTLIGRLLHDCNSIFEDQLLNLKKEKNSEDNEEIEFAYLLDGLSAEREQGITIDVAYRYFATPKRRFIIADVPGHEQYTRNMVTGASTANLAMILVDARKGIQTQSKRHLFITSLLGIPHVSILINKMDLVDYKEEVFEKIKRDFLDFSAKLDLIDIQFIPISALKGDMVVERKSKMPWYEGTTLLSYLNNVQITSDRNLIDFRFPIQLVMRPNQDFRGYAGKIESGSITIGEDIIALPSGQKSKIKSITSGENTLNYAFTPQSVVIRLENELDLSRGDMIVRNNNLPEIANNMEATICWMNEKEMEINKSYLLKQTTKTTRCYINELKYRLNVNTLHREETANLSLNEIGRVKINTNNPLLFDSYKKNKNTGSFILIDELTNETVGAGMIINKGKKTDYIKNEKSFNQSRGAVLWFTGLSGSGKSTIADKLFNYLQGKKINCEQLDGDIIRESLCSDLGFSKEDRVKNVERAGFVAKLLSRNSVIVLASFISPYKEMRDKLRADIPNFLEVFVNTSLEVCEKRDVKGLYKKVRNGEIDLFTGISDAYQSPENAEIEIDTENCSVDEAVESIVEYLISNNYLQYE